MTGLGELGERLGVIGIDVVVFAVGRFSFGETLCVAGYCRRSRGGHMEKTSGSLSMFRRERKCP